MPGFHLARFVRADRRQLIIRAEIRSVVASLVVIAAGVVIEDVQS